MGAVVTEVKVRQGAGERRDARRGRSAGFTLLEVLIAMSALGLAIVGTLSAQMVCRDLARQSRETTLAMSDLQACMEELLLEPPGNLPLPGSRFQEGIPVPEYANLHLESQDIFAIYPNWNGGPVPSPLDVDLTITWDDFRGRPRSLQLSTAVVP